jgi:hypothetical protein
MAGRKSAGLLGFGPPAGRRSATHWLPLLVGSRGAGKGFGAPGRHVAGVAARGRLRGQGPAQSFQQRGLRGLGLRDPGQTELPPVHQFKPHFDQLDAAELVEDLQGVRLGAMRSAFFFRQTQRP